MSNGPYNTMISIPGYTISDEIMREGNNFVVYRGVHATENYKVLVKIPKDHSNSDELLEQFRYEYELVNTLNGEGTVKAYPLEKYQNGLALILEDFGNYSLQDLLQHKKKLATEEFLSIALRITEALEKIHHNHIIHQNLNPENILWDEQTEQAKIIDFSLASMLSREVAEIHNTDLLQVGKLHYISPEQTGRMNRGIDYRTDYYSLGIIFYQMLTGELPFKSDDIGELVHFHIAKIPISPSMLDSSVPQVFSDIIMKLLAKTSEDRYQSLFGLKEDIKTSIDQIKMTGQIELFRIGEKDLHAHFRISEKFYGREEDLEHLVNAFNQASLDRARLILVAGYAGIGKSTLVHELYKPLVEKRGYFIAGKFDQFKRNIPYMSLAQAFEGFIQQISTLGEQQISIWREKMLEALGPNGKIVLDVIPGLASIIGVQPPVPILGPAETQNRFNLVFQNFIRSLATDEHPLAIFLDDLQWADLPSLKLLENLLLYPESKHFLIVGSYRDNEVGQDHILMTTLEILRKAGFYFNIIELKPLALEHVTQLLMDTLHHDEKTVKALAAICYEKTQGNPFFLNQFLQTLHQERLFEFNFNTDHWYWDVNKIKEKGITSNVVELMVQKLKELPQDTQKVIQLASCLGNKFNLSKLALINGKSPKETAQDIWAALDKGLIVPTGTSYKYVSDANNADVNYRFSHDRVQQAAYSMLEEDYRNWLRLKIGRILLDNTPENKLDDAIIEIVNQANFGIDLMTDLKERAFFSKLNLIAGKKAKASVAYKVALNYLDAGILLLEKDSWKKQYDLTLALYTETVEAAYLATEFEKMERSSKIVIDNAKKLLDKIKVYEIQILYLTNHHEYEKAIAIMQFVLRSTGINLPDKPSKFHIILYLIRTKLALMGKKVNELEYLPEMTDPQSIAALRIIRCTAGAAFLANPNLFVVTGLQAILLLIKHGNTPQAARSYVVYGHILCGALNQIETGYQFGQLSMNLCEKYSAENIMAQVWMVHGIFIKHWHDSSDESTQLAFNAFQKGLETGDIEYAGYSIAGVCVMNITHGKELSSIEKDIIKYKNLLISIEQKTGYLWLSVTHQAVLNLLALSQETKMLKGSGFDEDVAFSEIIARKDNIGGLVICTMKLLLCYLFDDYQQAYEWGKKGNTFIGAIGVFLLPPYYFLYSLACLAYHDIAPDNERHMYLKQVKFNQKKMRLWAKHAPMNYKHRYYLVEAELARVNNNPKKAELYYD